MTTHLPLQFEEEYVTTKIPADSTQREENTRGPDDGPALSGRQVEEEETRSETRMASLT